MKNNFVNLLRGLAIFLMLWGHCIQYCIPIGVDFFENPIFKIIYSFHMPLFMLISGYLFYFSFEKRDMKTLLAHRCKGLIHAIVFCGIFIYFTTTVVFSVINGNISPIINGGWLSSLSGLWFIWSVLGASIVVGVVCKKITKLWLQIVLVVFGGLFVILLPNYDLNLFMYPYFIIGFYFAKYKQTLFKKIDWLKYVFLPLFPVMMLFFDKKHYIYTSGIFGDKFGFWQYVQIDLFRWAIGLVGSLFVIVLMEIVYKLIVSKTPKFALWNGVSYLGEKSLQIYALSSAFLSFYLPIVYSKIIQRFPAIDLFFSNHIWLYNLGFSFVLGIVYSVCISLIIKLFEKIKFSKVLFGR